MAKPVSQSRTMWVAKGTVVGGKKVKKGYVAQYGKPERRVTGNIRLETKTAKRGKKGDVVSVKRGRYVAPKSSSGSARTETPRVVKEVTTLPKTVTQTAADRVGFSSSAANRGGYSAAGYASRLSASTSARAASAKKRQTRKRTQRPASFVTKPKASTGGVNRGNLKAFAENPLGYIFRGTGRTYN